MVILESLQCLFNLDLFIFYDGPILILCLYNAQYFRKLDFN